MIDVVEHAYKCGKMMYRDRTTEIVLHCTATKEGQDYSVDDIDRWHKNRGWNCIGYHYVIYRDGTIVRGRPMGAIGAHCSGHNSKSVGVVYVGGLGADGKAKDTRTVAQKRSMRLLVEWLMAHYSLRIKDVYGHCEFAAKACPSFSPKSFREELLAD